MPYVRKQSKHLGLYRAFFLMVLCVCAIVSGVRFAEADAAAPVAVLYPTEAVGLQPGQELFVQVAALGWEGVEIWDGTQAIAASDGAGPNHAVSFALYVEGTYLLEAVGVSGALRSAPQPLPPIVVKSGAASVADIVPIAKQLSAGVLDFNGDGSTTTTEDRKDDLKAALRLVRPPSDPAPVIRYAIRPGQEPGALRIDYAPNASHLYYELASMENGSLPRIPAIGSAPMGTPVGSGVDIHDGAYYSHLRLTETDADNKVLRFSSIRLHDGMFMSVLNGYVSDWNGNPVQGAMIELRAGANNTSGAVVAQTATDTEGAYNVRVPAGEYTLRMQATGYETSNVNVAVTRMGTYYEMRAISKLEADQIRIVLNWGATARDLDSHLLGPDGNGGIFHLYYGNTVVANTYGEIAKLDRDDTNWNGQETVTVTTVNRHVYGTFNYYVHNYSSGEGTLRGSSAKVEVYTGTLEGGSGEVNEALLKSYTIPGGPGTETFWEVFHLIVSPDEVVIADKNLVRETRPVLTKIAGAVPNEGAANAFTLHFLAESGYGYFDSLDRVGLEDLHISATLNGAPYSLSGVQYDPTTRVVSFDPIAPSTAAQQLVVAVQAAPGSGRLLPGSATAILTVPPAVLKAELTGLNGLDYSAGLEDRFSTFLALSAPAEELTVGDMTVTANVYNTVTGVTYHQVALSDIQLEVQNGAWVLGFRLDQQQLQYPTGVPLQLTLTVAANQQSALLSGSASSQTEFTIILMAKGDSFPLAATYAALPWQRTGGPPGRFG